MRGVYFLIVLLSFSLVIDDASAGWNLWGKKKSKEEEMTSSTTLSSTSVAESTTSSSTSLAPSTTVSSTKWSFWKKTKKEGPSTAAPTSSTTVSPTPVSTPSTGPPQAGTLPKGSANKAIAAAGDPTLAVGVRNVGDKIREDVNANGGYGQPRKPEISYPKSLRPASGGPTGNYRDWADDFVGAERGGTPPKVPAEGPALPPGRNGDNKPTPQPAKPQHPSNPAPNNGNKVPATVSTPAPSAANQQPGLKVTPTAAPAVPAKPITPAPAAVPTKPTPAPAAVPAKPTPAPAAAPVNRPTLAPIAKPDAPKTWAQVAGGSGSASPSSPDASPRLPGHHGPAVKPPAKPAASSSVPAAGAAVAAAGAAAAGGAALINDGSKKTYLANPTYSKGTGVTDEDLEKLSEALFLKDDNNANRFITLNLQKQTTGSSTKDEATEPLLIVKPEAFTIPTIERVLKIHDNYNLDTRINEHISPLQRKEEIELVDALLSTKVMGAAMRFLTDKGYLKRDDYKFPLRQIWFNLYSRGEGKIGSTGFEHVFLTEHKGDEVSGLHNWIYFNAEETKNRLNYLGYIKKVDLGNRASIVKVHLKHNNLDKPVSNIFVGTSPELEMALYTVCFYTRPDGPCPVSLGGTKFNILTYKFKYRGKEHIGSAYPEI